jgi:hypothetical protein
MFLNFRGYRRFNVRIAKFETGIKQVAGNHPLAFEEDGTKLSKNKLLIPNR